MKLTLACLLLAALPPARAAAGARTAAVLSQESGAYQEAYDAFRTAFGAEVDAVPASDSARALRGAESFAAFGARAASQKFPPDAPLVYCLAPGFFIDPPSRSGPTVKISMRPSSPLFLDKVKRIQPGLKRLTVFWVSESYTQHMQELRSAGGARGLEITLARVRRPDQLPGLLRAGIGNMDAFFLPPDPLLITPETLQIFKQFSWGNSIPMYATTRGLAQQGAVAAVGVSFKQAGEEAARALKAVLAGEDMPEVVYPPEVEVTLNLSAARSCGITFSAETLRSAAYTYP